MVLDAQLGNLKDPAAETFFGRLRPRKGDGHLRLTGASVDVYREWCHFCVNVAHTYRELGARAVNVERGIFHMVRQGCEGLGEAAEIVKPSE